jgi:hypothetical protein
MLHCRKAQARHLTVTIQQADTSPLCVKEKEGKANGTVEKVRSQLPVVQTRNRALDGHRG